MPPPSVPSFAHPHTHTPPSPCSPPRPHARFNSTGFLVATLAVPANLLPKDATGKAYYAGDGNTAVTTGRVDNPRV